MSPLIRRLGGLFRKWRRGSKPRLSPRLSVEQPADLFLDTGEWRPAVLQDVSAGGAALRTYERLRAGEQIWLAMRLAFDQRYETPARVVHSKRGAHGTQTRYGVRFLWTNYEECCRLDTFVTERVRGGSPSHADALAELIVLDQPETDD